MTFADVYHPAYDPSTAIINEMISTPDQIHAFNRCMADSPFYQDVGVSHDRAITTALAVVEDDSWDIYDVPTTSRMTDAEFYAMLDEYDL